MAYDSRVYELVEVFLSDSPEKDTEDNRAELAQYIQNELESYIAYILKAVEEPPAAENPR